MIRILDSQPWEGDEPAEGLVVFEQYAAGAGTEALRWKCQHLSVYSGLHTFATDIPPELIDRTRDDLFAYWTTIAACGCAPPIPTPG